MPVRLAGWFVAITRCTTSVPEGLILFTPIPPYSKLTGMSEVNATREEIHSSVVARRKELLSLETGWDGYGGKPVSAEAFDDLVERIDSEGALIQIVPGSEGSLQAEWHLRGDVSIEFNRDAEGEILLYVSYKPTPAEGG